MWDLVRNPEDWFSHNEAQVVLVTCLTSFVCYSWLNTYTVLFKHVVGFADIHVQ